MPRQIVGLIVLVTVLTGCFEEEVTVIPPPVTLSMAATGYYCNMTVMEHPGPKGQIHLKSKSEPVWFSSVRDTVAFTILPEEPADIAVIYVNDMGKAPSWDQPGDTNWIDAKSAHYVLGSNKRGGMGAPEAVPFGVRSDAEQFASEHGGTVMVFREIPKNAILGMMSYDQNTGGGHDAHSSKVQ